MFFARRVYINGFINSHLASARRILKRFIFFSREESFVHLNRAKNRLQYVCVCQIKIKHSLNVRISLRVRSVGELVAGKGNQ